MPPAVGYTRRDFFYRHARGAPASGLRRVTRLAEHVPDMLRYRAAASAADVVHFQWLSVPRLDARLLPRRRPLVITAHDILPREGGAGLRAAQAALLRHFDAVIAHSATGRDRLINEAGLSPDRVHTIPHGAFSHLAALPLSPLPIELENDPAKPVVLSFGLIRPYKGLDVLLQAMARAPLHVTLTVAGEFWGTAEAQTRARIGRLGLHSRVTLRPGYVPADQIPGLFAGTDALVLPYRTATSSQNAWLAFEYGVPVVATRAGTLADAVRDGVDGVVCEPGDEDDLLRALLRISAPGEAARLRAAVQAADPGDYWDAYLEALLSFAEQPGREPGLAASPLTHGPARRAQPRGPRPG